MKKRAILNGPGGEDARMNWRIVASAVVLGIVAGCERSASDAATGTNVMQVGTGGRTIDHDDEAEQLEPVAVEELSGPVRTDKGRTVRLHRAKGRVSSPGELAAWADVERQRGLNATGPRDEPCNCHGWVFTGGRYWLLADELGPILRDNGYAPVREPRAGDVVVYHDSAGRIVHTGLVRSVEPLGGPMVESRWGEMGRYLHAASDQPYAGRCIYLRSSRSGHVLAGLEEDGRPE